MVMDLVQYRKKRCLNYFEVSLVLDSESHMDDRLMDIDRLEWCSGRAGSWLWKTGRNFFLPELQLGIGHGLELQVGG